jgi:hypothetical protein
MENIMQDPKTQFIIFEFIVIFYFVSIILYKQFKNKK